MEQNGREINNQALQNLLELASADHQGLGLQATVIFADGSVWNGAAGLADRKNHCPMTTSHHMYIGSMTKLFTAALVLDQVESNGFSLDDPLEHWLAYSPGREVSLRRLLNHTSGIPNYTNDAWFAARYILLANKIWQPAELFRVIANKPLEFVSGSRHEYSNSNYILLGLLLEQASGKSYPQLLDERLLQPLGLTETFCLNRPADLLTANGYDQSQLHLGLVNVTGLRTSLESGAWAAGCILSTSQDVAVFTRGLFSGEILSAESLREMTSFVDAPDEHVPFQTGYGLGVRWLEIGGDGYLGHTGTIPGYSGAAFYNTNSRDTIVILSNLSGFDALELLGKFQRVLTSKN